jgi:hypothetical protein
VSRLTASALRAVRPRFTGEPDGSLLSQGWRLSGFLQRLANERYLRLGAIRQIHRVVCFQGCGVPRDPVRCRRASRAGRTRRLLAARHHGIARFQGRGVPLDPNVRESGDAGKPIVANRAEAVAAQALNRNRAAGCRAHQRDQSGRVTIAHDENQRRMRLSSGAGLFHFISARYSRTTGQTTAAAWAFARALPPPCSISIDL